MKRFRIASVPSADTHDLRRMVLRDGDSDAEMVWSGDDDDGTVHLAALTTDGDVVGVSTWLARPDPMATTLDAVQLRGMATDPTMRGAGIGADLLAAGVDRARERGAERVWANARVTALGFYERAGFTVTGDVFATADTGLPHLHVHVDLGHGAESTH